MAKNAFVKEPELTFGSVCLVKTKNNLDDARLSLLKHLITEKKMHGIYLAFDKPGYKTFSKNNKEFSGLVKSLFVIDAKGGARIPDAEGQIALQGPTALSELSVYITKLTHDMSYRFVVIDSINKIVASNGEEATVKFVEYASSKVRRLDMNCIMFFMTDKKTKNLMKTLERVSDQRIEIK